MKRKEINYHEKYAEFYNSVQWRNLRNQKFYSADGLCEMCKKNGIVREAKEIHHIEPIELNWDKRLDYDNLIALCPEHHNLMHERISPLQQFLKEWEDI